MRLVIILNRTFPLPAQINAAGHLCVGAFELASKEDLAMRRFTDRDGIAASVLTDLPLIVLEGTSNTELAATHRRAHETGVAAAGFFDCMRTGSPEDQACVVGAGPMAEQSYIGLLLIGSKAALKPLTKRYVLYRDMMGEAVQD